MIKKFGAPDLGFLRQMTENSAVIRTNSHLSVCLPLIEHPACQLFIWLDRLQHPQGHHIGVRRGELELLSDLRDLVDHVCGGAIATPDLVLLNDFKSLGWDPIFTS